MFMPKKFFFVLLAILAGIFSANAERWLSVIVPVKQALTEAAFPSDAYVPSFEICTVPDSTVVAKSTTILDNTIVIAGFSAEDEKGKFLIHVFVEKKNSDGNTFKSNDFEDAWLPLDLSKIEGKRYQTDDVLIPIRKAK